MAILTRGTKLQRVRTRLSYDLPIIAVVLIATCLPAQSAQRSSRQALTPVIASYRPARISAIHFSIIWSPGFWNPGFLENAFVYLLGGLSLGVLIGFLARTPERRRVQQSKGNMGLVLEERNRIAQECHDTLMAGFSAISWQLEATVNLFRDSNEAQSPAAKSCELARSMVLLCQAEARRIIYDLRETEEVTSSLSKALLRMLEENHRSAGSALHFDMEGEEVSLSPGSVHHLARIAQEAVHNALRHAQPSSISMRLIYEPELLRLIIRDDGRGFRLAEAAARNGHFGIAVMQERARKVGGTLRLHSDSSGTEVEAAVPYDAIYLNRNVNREVKDKEVVQWIGL